MNRNRLVLILAAFLLAQAPLLAGHVIVGNPANSTSGLGDFTATLSYSATDASNATLVVTLTNTTPAAGGYITAFVLNNPGNAITGITIPDDAGVELLGGATFQNSVNGSPFGQFDFGVSTGGSFEGGGPPTDGLAVGDTGVVTFSLTGVGLDLLNEESFVNELSVGPGDGQGHEFMVVRFRGMEGLELQSIDQQEMPTSDKVPGQVQDTPEPSTMLLSCLGLAALVPAWRRRLRS